MTTLAGWLSLSQFLGSWSSHVSHSRVSDSPRRTWESWRISRSQSPESPAGCWTGVIEVSQQTSVHGTRESSPRGEKCRTKAARARLCVQQSNKRSAAAAAEMTGWLALLGFACEKDTDLTAKHQHDICCLVLLLRPSEARWTNGNSATYVRNDAAVHGEVTRANHQTIENCTMEPNLKCCV